MEFKGTKGEWKTQYNGAYWEVTTSEDCERIKVLDIGVFSLDRSGVRPKYNFEESEANAHLIAAALNLLYALQDLVRFCEDNSVGAELEYAKDAINKALNK